jgi:hypothetical protein
MNTLSIVAGSIGLVALVAVIWYAGRAILEQMVSDRERQYLRLLDEVARDTDYPREWE